MQTTYYRGALNRQWTGFYAESWKALKAFTLAGLFFTKLLYLLADGAFGLFLRGPCLTRHRGPHMQAEKIPDGRHRQHGPYLPY